MHNIFDYPTESYHAQLDQWTFYAKLFNSMPSQFDIAQNHFKD